MAHHPSVGSEAWVVQEEKEKEVSSDGSIYLTLRVLGKEVNPSGEQTGKISSGTLLAQITCSC